MLDPEHTLNGGLSEKPEPEKGSSSGDSNERAPGTSRELQSLAIEASGSQRLPHHKATGPRTEIGKRRASRNARTHAIFSKVVVLEGESRAEYERLLTGLGEALQPEGAIEKLLVEKLATTAWRQRRLLLAEGAEIRKNTEFFAWDQRNSAPENSPKFELRWAVGTDGLIQKIKDPNVLRRCLQGLSELREQLQENGFDREADNILLEKIYGCRDPDLLREDLYDSYETCRCTSEIPEEERTRYGYAPSELCQKRILQEIDAEIRRLKRYRKEQASIETARTQLEVLSRNVPDASVLDRVLRYESSLERYFDRTLSQLERLQRIRRGQSVPPPINVNIS